MIFYLSMLEYDSDKELFTWLYTNYEKSMFSVALSFCPVKEDAEDLLQKTFVKVVKYIYSKHSVPENGLYAWLVEILKNTYIDDRKRKSSQFVTISFDETEEISVDDFSEQVVQNESFENMIRKLPELDKEVLRMKFILGYDSERIAAVIGATNAAVRKRVERAIAKLRNSYREDEHHE